MIRTFQSQKENSTNDFCRFTECIYVTLVFSFLPMIVNDYLLSYVPIFQQGSLATSQWFFSLLRHPHHLPFRMNLYNLFRLEKVFLFLLSLHLLPYLASRCLIDGFPLIPVSYSSHIVFTSVGAFNIL